MKCIGLIGGISWVATSAYYQRLNQDVGRRLGDSASADLVSGDRDDDGRSGTDARRRGRPDRRRRVQHGSHVPRRPAAAGRVVPAPRRCRSRPSGRRADRLPGSSRHEVCSGRSILDGSHQRRQAGRLHQARKRGCRPPARAGVLRLAHRVRMPARLPSSQSSTPPCVPGDATMRPRLLRPLVTVVAMNGGERRMTERNKGSHEQMERNKHGGAARHSGRKRYWGRRSVV